MRRRLGFGALGFAQPINAPVHSPACPRWTKKAWRTLIPASGSASLDLQARRVQSSINLLTPHPKRCKRQRLRKRFASKVLKPVNGGPDEFAEYIRRENARWSDVAQAAGLRS